MEDERDVIVHLFEVERQAAGLLSDAQDEYDKRIAVVREKVEADYKAAYETLIVEQEERLKNETHTYKAEHESAFSAYCDELRSREQDTVQFNSFLEKCLFKI